jgi:HEAT repeat protein
MLVARSLVLGLLILLAPACGTIAVQCCYWTQDLHRPESVRSLYVYGGTASEVVIAFKGVSGDPEYGGGESSSYGVSGCLGPLLLLDLPLTLAADTLLLPLCIYQQVKAKEWNEEKFVAALEGRDPVERERAARALGYVEGASERGTRALIVALHDEDRQVRRSAILALRERGSPSSAAAPDLLPILRDPDPPMRYAAASALRHIQPDPAAVLAPLRALVKDPDAAVRQIAIGVLGSLGSAAAPAVPELIEALRDPDTHVVGAAMNALGAMGPAAAAANDALRALMERDPSHREYAERALFRIRYGDAPPSEPAQR